MKQLEEIEGFLKEEGFDTDLLDEERRLLLFLSVDDTEGESILHIVEESDPLSEERGIVKLTFLLPICKEVKNKAIYDLASLVTFLNGEAALPGFEYLQAEGILRFRYVLFTAIGALKKELILSIIGMIQANVTIFSPILHAIANDEITLNEALQQALDQPL